MAIDKFCTRWDLEVGFFTYSIITLIVKIYAASILFFVVIFTNLEWLKILGVHIFSWLIATVGMQFMSLMGIVQKKSILLQPYFVVLVLEPFVLLFTIIMCHIYHNSTAKFIIVEAFAVPVDIYSAMCLRSLYKKYLPRVENLQATDDILEF